MNILVTGGFGYLGGRLSQCLSTSENSKIFLGSRIQKSSPFWLPAAHTMQTKWECDANLNKICSGMDYIIHLSGMNSLDCLEDSIKALEINVVATARLLKAAIKQGVKRFIYLSTVHVYGMPLIGVLTEETLPNPVHPYATSNRAAEDIVLAAHRNGEIEGIVIRLANAFGKPASLDNNCWMLLVNNLCRQAILQKNMTLQSSGQQQRNFITMTDACNAIKYLLYIHKMNLGNGVFNVGGVFNYSILGMTQMIQKRLQHITGDLIKIIYKESARTCNIDKFEYRIDKLLGTGFSLVNNIEKEIDQLIYFCINNFR